MIELRKVNDNNLWGIVDGEDIFAKEKKFAPAKSICLKKATSMRLFDI